MGPITKVVSNSAVGLVSAVSFGACCASRFGISSAKGAAFGTVYELFACIGAEVGQRVFEKNQPTKPLLSENILYTEENAEVVDFTVFGHRVNLSVETTELLKETAYKCTGAFVGIMTGAVVVHTVDTALSFPQNLLFSVAAVAFSYAATETTVNFLQFRG